MITLIRCFRLSIGKLVDMDRETCLGIKEVIYISPAIIIGE
ncbi:hypothetical protein ACE09Y_00855 [Raphidiopsis sp. BLCC-F218]